jgi:uncharacterized RDD family membrane protein YckC
MMAATITSGVTYAGFWRRFGAMIVDSVVLCIGGGVLLAALDAAGIPMFLNSDYTAETQDLSASVGFSADLSPPAVVLSVVGQWLYFAIFESSGLQGTPGKLALGLRVTDLEGKRIGFWRATGRNLGKIVSSVILFIGYLMAGWTKRKQALHDMMAGCLVVSGRA